MFGQKDGLLVCLIEAVRLRQRDPAWFGGFLCHVEGDEWGRFEEGSGRAFAGSSCPSLFFMFFWPF